MDGSVDGWVAGRHGACSVGSVPGGHGGQSSVGVGEGVSDGDGVASGVGGAVGHVLAGEGSGEGEDGDGSEDGEGSDDAEGSVGGEGSVDAEGADEVDPAGGAAASVVDVPVGEGDSVPDGDAEADDVALACFVVFACPARCFAAFPPVRGACAETRPAAQPSGVASTADSARWVGSPATVVPSSRPSRAKRCW